MCNEIYSTNRNFFQNNNKDMNLNNNQHQYTRQFEIKFVDQNAKEVWESGK